tara:strand:+ start:3032 stop:3538 length:507 start_codon:yes stop_codon:yes gene_type:complete
VSRRSGADPGARRLRDVRGVQVAASQPRDRVGDIEGTIGTVVRHLREAQAAGAVLVCFPKCYLQGYVVDPAVTPDLAITTDSAPFRRLLLILDVPVPSVTNDDEMVLPARLHEDIAVPYTLVLIVPPRVIQHEVVVLHDFVMDFLCGHRETGSVIAASERRQPREQTG